MSLFGEFPDDPPAAKQKSSLFDEPTHSRSGSGLFNDDDDAGWGLPTPKKARRAQLIKSLLVGGEVPEVYVDVFDALEAEKRSVEGILGEAKDLDEDSKTRILEIFGGDGERELGRGEVNVLLALVGLGQEGEEVSLDGVDERRNGEFVFFFGVGCDEEEGRLSSIALPHQSLDEVGFTKNCF